MDIQIVEKRFLCYNKILLIRRLSKIKTYKKRTRKIERDIQK